LASFLWRRTGGDARAARNPAAELQTARSRAEHTPAATPPGEAPRKLERQS